MSMEMLVYSLTVYINFAIILRKDSIQESVDNYLHFNKNKKYKSKQTTKQSSYMKS